MSPSSSSPRRQWLDADLETVRGEMHGRVLEVGGGHARRRGRFRPPYDAVKHWVHLDLDPHRVPDVRADVERLPLADDSFDVVICLEVLEYVKDVVTALGEMHRVLRAGGTLLLSTPFMHRADTADDYWRFTDPGLRHLLAQTGYRVVSVRPHGAALSVAMSVLKYALDRQPRVVRWPTGLIVWPLLLLLARLDAKAAAREPRLATFSLGYLVVARAA
jgi:SAM-dependent methyltransferase